MPASPFIPSARLDFQQNRLFASTSGGRREDETTTDKSATLLAKEVVERFLLLLLRIVSYFSTVVVVLLLLAALRVGARSEEHPPTDKMFSRLRLCAGALFIQWKGK